MPFAQPVPRFLDELAADPSEARKLRALGVDTPEHLLAQIKAAPAAFRQYLGADRVQVLIEKLEHMVPEDSPARRALDQPPGRLGVPLNPAPQNLADLKYDIGKRDALFRRIEMLKHTGAPLCDIRAAEEELDRLLESR